MPPRHSISRITVNRASQHHVQTRQYPVDRTNLTACCQPHLSGHPPARFKHKAARNPIPACTKRLEEPHSESAKSTLRGSLSEKRLQNLQGLVLRDWRNRLSLKTLPPLPCLASRNPLQLSTPLGRLSACVYPSRLNHTSTSREPRNQAAVPVCRRRRRSATGRKAIVIDRQADRQIR
jgi:hypothetical protein